MIRPSVAIGLALLLGLVPAAAFAQSATTDDLTNEYIVQEPELPLDQLVDDFVDPDATPDPGLVTKLAPEIATMAESADDGDGFAGDDFGEDFGGDDFGTNESAEEAATPDVIPSNDAAAMSSDATPASGPLPPAPIPDGWRAVEHFGVTLAIPADWEELEKKDLQLAIGKRLDGGGIAIALMFNPNAEIEKMIDEAKEGPKAAMLQTLPDVDLGYGESFAHLVLIAEDNGTAMSSDMLVSRASVMDEHKLVIGLTTIGDASDDIRRVGERILDSVRLSGPVEAPTQTFLDGFVTVKPSPGWFIDIGYGSKVVLATRAEDAIVSVHTATSSESLILLASRSFAEPPKIEQVSRFGAPGVLLSGQSTGDGLYVVEGQPGPLEYFVFDRCGTEGDSIIVELSASQQWAENNAIEDMTDGLGFHWPEEVSPCSEQTAKRLATTLSLIEKSRKKSAENPGFDPTKMPPVAEWHAFEKLGLAFSAPPAFSVNAESDTSLQLWAGPPDPRVATPGFSIIIDQIDEKVFAGFGGRDFDLLNESEVDLGNGEKFTFRRYQEKASDLGYQRNMLALLSVVPIAGDKHLLINLTSKKFDAGIAVPLLDSIMSTLRVTKPIGGTIAGIAAPEPIAADTGAAPEPVVADTEANATLPSSPKATPQTKTSAIELAFWNSIANSNDPADFEAYLAQFPNGAFVSLARIRASRLSAIPTIDMPDTSANSPFNTAPPPVSGPNGTFKFQDFGTMRLATGGDGAVVGDYTSGDGRIEGKIDGTVFSGRWIQTNSGQKCSDGGYWGLLHMEFSPDFQEVTGSWGYCGGKLDRANRKGSRTGDGMPDVPLPESATSTSPPVAAVGPVPRDWQTYVNDRYGVTIAYPADVFTPLPAPASNDGRRFAGRDGQASFYVFAQYNALGKSLAEIFSDDQTHADEQVGYKKLGPDWYVISGNRGSETFYRKAALSSDDLFQVFEIAYPSSQAEAFDPIVTRMAQSFPGQASNVAVPVTPSSTYSEPARGTAERKAIIDAARTPVARDIGRPVIFVVERLRSDGTWAYMQAVPKEPGGLPLNWSQSNYAGAWESDAMSDLVLVLLRKQSGQWMVAEYTIGPTDVAWYDWVDKYGLPEALFMED